MVSQRLLEVVESIGCGNVAVVRLASSFEHMSLSVSGEKCDTLISYQLGLSWWCFWKAS